MAERNDGGAAIPAVGAWSVRRSLLFICLISFGAWLGLLVTSSFVMVGDDRTTLAVKRPASGKSQAFAVRAGQTLRLEFPPQTAEVRQSGADLWLIFDDRGTVKLGDFVPAARSANPPQLVFGKDRVVPADLLLVQLGSDNAAVRLDQAITILPAAGKP